MPERINMQLEMQVCSLELSKRLKELGVKQESLFEWVRRNTTDGDTWDLMDLEDSMNYAIFPNHQNTVAAFTVAELGEMLPEWCESGRNNHYKSSTPWYCNVNECEHLPLSARERNKISSLWANTEANARAKMLIYLLEQKIITLN